MATEEAGDKLTLDELLVMLRLLLIAGNETTTNLIGNGMLALLRHPDQLQKLRAHPDLMDTAVEEMLRYDTTVQLDFRTALEDVEIGGQRITTPTPQGRIVFGQKDTHALRSLVRLMPSEQGSVTALQQIGDRIL